MDFLNELYNGLLAMSWLEGFGVFFGVLYIFFAARESIWCWPASLIGVSIYLVICYQVQLYAEMGLQFYYLGTTIYGWWHWRNPGKKGELPVSRMKFTEHVYFIAGGLILTVGLGYFLVNETNAQLPYLDSFTTIFSIFTTLLVTRKVLENWLYWIVIDAVGAYIFFQRELYLTSVLFAAYVIIATIGYYKWRKSYNLQAT